MQYQTRPHPRVSIQGANWNNNRSQQTNLLQLGDTGARPCVWRSSARFASVIPLLSPRSRASPMASNKSRFFGCYFCSRAPCLDRVLEAGGRGEERLSARLTCTPRASLEYIHLRIHTRVTGRPGAWTISHPIRQLPETSRLKIYGKVLFVHIWRTDRSA